MKTITGNTEAEIVEKRSKFISNLYYVETVEQAENKLKEIKKKYNDARHNCFILVIFLLFLIFSNFFSKYSKTPIFRL